MDEFIKVMKSWKDFSGRARRREYWMFVLFVVIFAIVTSIIDAIINTRFISGLFVLIIIVPYLAVSVRRLHDIGKSGWWYFINFIPLIGELWFLYLTILEGQMGSNEYGPNPKEVNDKIQ